MFGNKLVKNAAIVPFAPQDFNGAATGSNWIDMANYGHASVCVMVGETAGATMAFTLLQATDNAATGAKALAFTEIFTSGQKLLINTVVGTFTVGETVTGGTSNLTAEVYEVASTYLLVRNLTGGTTWTDTEALSGGTSLATAVVSGTGQDEDILLPTYTAPSSTFTIPAVTFKTYAIEVDACTLDEANGFRYIQANLANPGSSTIGAGFILLTQPRYRGMPMPSVLGTKKIAADTA